MSKSRGHIVERSIGMQTIQVSGGFDDAGKRVRLTSTVPGNDENDPAVQRELTRLLRSIDTGTAVPTGTATLAKYLTDTWLPHIATRVRPATFRRYETLVNVHAIPKAGRVRMGKLRPLHVQGVLDAMTADGAAPASVLQCHRVLSSALRQAVRWQILATNPADAVRPPRPERPALHVPDVEHVRAILDAARGSVHEIPVLLAATTGMRRGETLGVRWSAIDLDAGVVRVVVTLQRVRGNVAYVPPKTDRSRRTVSLPASVVARLRAHRREQNRRRLLIGAAWHDTDLVCDRGDGEHLDPDGLTHAFRRFAKTAGVPGTRLHDLRHAFATTLLAAGVHPKIVSEALGHSSVAFTMETYQHVLPTMGGQVAAAIDAALGGIG